MRKNLCLLTLATLALASCSDNDLNDAPVIDGEMRNGVAMSQLITDQSILDARIAMMGLTPTNNAKGMSSRAAGTKHVDEPSIPASAVELKTGEWGGFDYYSGNEYWNNGGCLVDGVSDYYVPAGKEVVATYAQTRATDNLTIYVAGRLVISGIYNNPKLTFNVLKGGELVYTSVVTGQDNLMKVVDTINVWGKFSPGAGLHGLSICGGELNYYKGCDAIVIGDQQLPAEYASLNISDNGKLYAEEMVTVNGTAWMQDGHGDFMDGLRVNGNLTTKQGVTGGVYNIYECSYIYGQWVGESNSAGTFNIYDYLYCGSLHDNSSNVICNMYSSLVDIDSQFERTTSGYPLNLPADYKINRLVDKNAAGFQFIGKGNGYASVVRYLNNDLYLDDGNNCTVVEGSGVHKAMNVETSFQGNINLITSTIKCQYTHAVGQDLLYQQGVQEDILNLVNATASLNSPDCYLPAQGECRPAVGNDPAKPTTPVIVSPGHKYSATGMAFDDANGLIYLTWHSNIGNDHDTNPWHGTNWNYGNGQYSPNVEGVYDWGGIVDVIDINNYNPSTAEGLYRQSLIQNEHKYNHVINFGGMLYMPSESNKVEAAMHVIALNHDGTIPSEDGKLAASKNTRVNLTGGSANCVEVVNGKLATISGWSKGAVNFFSVGDYSNQSHRPVFGASEADFTKVNGEYVMSANNFGGKYITTSNGKVITLNNTDRGIISVFNTVGEDRWQPTLQFETGPITPRDGKDAIAVDGNNVYVCHSNNGLTVNDLATGQRVGGTFRGANCVDVDDKYIYVAAGDGLIVLSKTETYRHPEHNGALCNKVVKKVSFTGAGFTMPDGKLYVSDTNTVKQSANFVRVYTVNGKKYVFVAYGLYGLRFYHIDELGL